MIQGRFDEETNQLFFEISLVAADGEVIFADALLDTGFTGWLAINSQDLDFNWQLVDDEYPMKTARGEGNFSIYIGTVQIDQKFFDSTRHVIYPWNQSKI
ncbi:aspartyl protease [Microcoleus sp. N3A4]|uniref:aspartyl protease n=1 Tax=Microcoleus sp. N3A4 TaxID=3055379 RepID=UPI002FD206E4